MGTLKQFAEKLDGSEYTEIPGDLIDYGKERGFVIRYIYSGIGNHYLEEAGEFGVCSCEWKRAEGVKGENAKLFSVFYEGRDGFLVKSRRKIKAERQPRDEKHNIIAYWRLSADFPHETFDLMLDGDLYCIGIVYDIRTFKK